MSSIVEDEKIWKLFHDIMWLEVQLDDRMKAGEEDPFFGFIKESNLLSLDKRNEYKNKKAKLEEELYHFWFKVNRIEIRESLEGLDHVKALKAIRHGYSELADVWNDFKEEIIEHHRVEGFVDRDLFLENYYSLDPPYVKIGTIIPEGIKRICDELRWCYVYRQYNATVVLSRSVVETILKDKLKIKPWEYVKTTKTINEAESNSIISDNTAEKAREITKHANNILHQGSIAEKEDAKSSLDFILKFLEEIYF